MTEPQQDAIRRLAECRRFSGEPGEFWPRYLEALGLLVGAERGLLLLRDPAAGWKPFRQWPQGGGAFSMPLKLDETRLCAARRGGEEMGLPRSTARAAVRSASPRWMSPGRRRKAAAGANAGGPRIGRHHGGGGRGGRRAIAPRPRCGGAVPARARV
ncbi:MAG: hypothetical protein R3F11_03510 [Verrucomicrobiales bacterium]